jgi:hypothetical protein
MRPVVRGNQPAGYDPSGNLGVKKNSKIWKKLHQSITVGQATDAVWGVKMFDFNILPKPPYYNNYQPLVDNIYTNLEDRYPAAGQYLIERLGATCVYCEIASASYEVDHAVPKRPYIGTIVDWDNLLPACPTCNRLKSNNPNFQTVNGWVTNPGTQAEYVTEVRGKYFWPDRYDNTYPEIAPELHLKVGNNWQVINARRFDLNVTTFANPVNRLIEATYTNPINNHQTTYSARVYLIAGNNNADADETIDLLNLNRVQDIDNDDKYGKITDFRLYKRTEAWFSVLRKMRLLTLANTQVLWDGVWQDILNSAQQVGFYSVWVKVLSNFQKNGQNLGRKFITDSANLFPGTDQNILNYVP